MGIPPLCANGCGFYGSSANDNLCSKCYRHALTKKMALFSLPEDSKGEETKIDDPVSVANKESCASDIPEKKKRCKSCNRKVGLTGFECRCGDLFCGSHRYPEEHACTVDFKHIGRQLLIQQNPLCRGDKLEGKL